MTKLALPEELISLVHHVELNKAGWWDKAVQRLILATVWSSDKSLTTHGLVHELRKTLGINLRLKRVKKQVESLCASGTLVRLPSGQLKISEEKLDEFTEDLERVRSIQEEVRQKFVDVLIQYYPTTKDPDPLWNSFNDDLLVPLINELGVKTYELVSGSRVDLEKIPKFSEFLQSYPSEVRQPLRKTIIDFMDPKDPNVRSYVIRYLNAYFFLEASRLKDRTLRMLASFAGSQELFSVLVDTNFLFSILSLHDNPSNEAAVSLIDLIEEISQFVTVNLYVFPLTIDEAKRVLRSCRDTLADLRLTPNLAEAAASNHISGLAKKFIEECRKAGRPISAEAYFTPYITRLVEIAASRGVRFLDEDVGVYSNDDAIQYEIQRQADFQWRRFGESGKNRQTLEHDIVLWHLVKGKRPKYVGSPLDAKYWIVTVDYGFLGFDDYKRKEERTEVPVCLHPTALIQMLQFWVPRTPEMEEAILGSLRLPFLFQAFDPEDEATTIKILEVLSRFQDVGDLSEETVAHVLLDEVLRQRMSTEPDLESQIELIKEAIAANETRLREELNLAQDQVEQEKLARQEDQGVLNHQTAKISELEQQLQGEIHVRQSLEERITRFEGKARERDLRETTRKAVVDFCLKWVLFPLVLAALLTYGILFLLMNSPQLASLTRWGRCWPAIGVWSVLMLPYIWLADRHGSADLIIRDWPPFSFFHRAKKRLFLAFGALFSSIVCSALYDWVKSIIASSGP